MYGMRGKDPQADPGSGQGEQNNGQGGQNHEQKPDPKPVAPGQNGNGNDGQNGNNGQNSPSAVKTGDETPTAMWAGIVVISGTGADRSGRILVQKKKDEINEPLGAYLDSRKRTNEAVILTKGCHPNPYRKRVTSFDLLSDFL